MSNLICPFCESELSYNDDLDERGEPFCTCFAAELERTADRLAEVVSENSAQAARIAELEAALRWIPVEERLPEIDWRYYLVTIDLEGTLVVHTARFAEGVFGYTWLHGRVVAWRPFPAPYDPEARP
jgi:hypothetical protein